MFYHTYHRIFFWIVVEYVNRSIVFVDNVEIVCKLEVAAEVERFRYLADGEEFFRRLYHLSGQRRREREFFYGVLAKHRLYHDFLCAVKLRNGCAGYNELIAVHGRRYRLSADGYRFDVGKIFRPDGYHEVCACGEIAVICRNVEICLYVRKLLFNAVIICELIVNCRGQDFFHHCVPHPRSYDAVGRAVGKFNVNALCVAV